MPVVGKPGYLFCDSVAAQVFIFHEGRPRRWQADSLCRSEAGQ
jgi:hypothetical protein